MIRVAINGYGRIGRLAHRVILEKHASEIDVVAINAGSSTDIKGWMYLLKYDTAYGQLTNRHLDFRVADPQLKDSIGYLIVDNKEIPVFSQKDPSLLPWRNLEVDVVIESSGEFRKEEQIKTHLDSGAKAVVLSAPTKDPSGHSTASSDLRFRDLSDSRNRIGAEQGIPSYVLSVNWDNYQGEKIISNASCTTNCIAPVTKIMRDNFGIEKAMMTTIHAYTSDQRLQDGGHKDYRRARAASQSIIPTSTGATDALTKVIPGLEDIFGGLAIRVPVITGSLSDFTFLLKKATSKEEINDVFKKEANNLKFQGILTVTEDPLVSSDIIGNPYSAIVDLTLTQVVGGNLAKVIAWYDNEYGYTNRLVEEVIMVGRNIPKTNI